MESRPGNVRTYSGSIVTQPDQIWVVIITSTVWYATYSLWFLNAVYQFEFWQLRDGKGCLLHNKSCIWNTTAIHTANLHTEYYRKVEYRYTVEWTVWIHSGLHIHINNIIHFQYLLTRIVSSVVYDFRAFDLEWPVSCLS